MLEQRFLLAGGTKFCTEKLFNLVQEKKPQKNIHQNDPTK
jgi:hypothetical protein